MCVHVYTDHNVGIHPSILAWNTTRQGRTTPTYLVEEELLWYLPDDAIPLEPFLHLSLTTRLHVPLSPLGHGVLLENANGRMHNGGQRQGRGEKSSGSIAEGKARCFLQSQRTVWQYCRALYCSVMDLVRGTV